MPTRPLGECGIVRAGRLEACRELCRALQAKLQSSRTEETGADPSLFPRAKGGKASFASRLFIYGIELIPVVALLTPLLVAKVLGVGIRDGRP